jgi:hypothetical protein
LREKGIEKGDRICECIALEQYGTFAAKDDIRASRDKLVRAREASEHAEKEISEPIEREYRELNDSVRELDHLGNPIFPSYVSLVSYISLFHCSFFPSLTLLEYQRRMLKKQKRIINI